MERIDFKDEEDCPENAEVILLVDDFSFSIQRRLLAEKSAYFNAMFNSGMLESTAEVIELKEVCPQAMKKIIRYLKTNYLTCPADHISSLLEAAVMYQFVDIQNRCVATLKENLSMGTCLGIMFLTDKFAIRDVHRLAKDMALWNFEAVLLEQEFLMLPVKHVVKYLSHDGLKVSSEEAVLNCVLRWMKHESTRFRHYEQLFSTVRFSYIDFKILKNLAHDSLVRRCPKMKRLVHEIWKEKFHEHQQSNNSPLSISPLSSVSPSVEELENEDDESPVYLLPCPCPYDFLKTSDAEQIPAASAQMMPEFTVEQVLARRLLSTGPRSIPMVPAVVLCNSKDKSQAPILIYFSEEGKKPVKIGSMKKASHGFCKDQFNVASGFKACTVGNCVYIVGGEFMMGHGNWNNGVWKYNTFAKSWMHLVNLQNPRRHHALCVMDDGIYLIGGIGRFRVAQDTVQRIDIVSGNITDLTPMPVPITSAAVTEYQGKLYIFESLIYRYNADSNSWSCLKSVSLPPLGFHSALPHANGIYLIGRCTTQLSLYCPECLSEPYLKATFNKVGDFQFPTENACLVGNKIFTFSSTEFLAIESYDIGTNVFAIEYVNEDGSFLGPQYQHGCFSLPRY